MTAKRHETPEDGAKRETPEASFGGFEIPEISWPADAVSRVPTASLIPSARNARTHSDAQVSQIAASIREWGWTVPVLVDEQGTLIAGHGRLLAAQVLGLPEVPVMVARGWSEAKRRAYAIADNKLALNAGWDDPMLALELSALAADGFDLGLTGFDAGEMSDLMNGVAPDEAQPPDDFKEVDEDIPTEHKCPKCGYQWSGGE